MSKADSVVAGTPPLRGSVYSDTVTTTHLSYKTPDEWKGRKVRIQVYGNAVDIQFHSALTTAVVYGQQSTHAVTTGVLTAHAASGGHIPADTWDEFDIDNLNAGVDDYFSIEGAGTAIWIGFATSER
jgi:hypothetical protein